MARRPMFQDHPPPPWGDDHRQTAPQDVNLIWRARQGGSSLRSCAGSSPTSSSAWGFPWKIPQDALDVPRYGSVNQHPAKLPRHRGPIPLSWALRDGDGVLRHLALDGRRARHGPDPRADVDPDPRRGDDDVRARAEAGPAGLEFLPRVFERLAAGDPGDPQDDRGRVLGGHARRGLRDHRLVAAGAPDPQPGARAGATRSTWARSRGRSPSSTASA